MTIAVAGRLVWGSMEVVNSYIETRPLSVGVGLGVILLANKFSMKLITLYSLGLS